MDTIGVDERRVRNARIALQRANAGSRDDASVVRAVLAADDAWCRDNGVVVAADDVPRSLVRLVTALRFVYGDERVVEVLESIVEGAVGPAAVGVPTPTTASAGQVVAETAAALETATRR